jgi:hypothetical protein
MSRATSGREAVIVSTARTPLTKSWKGAFNMTHGATLGGHVIKAAVERAKVDPASIEDVIMGCAYPEGATGFNIARQASLRAGLPVTVAGVTVNRFCSDCKASRWLHSASSPVRVMSTWPVGSSRFPVCRGTRTSTWLLRVG